MIKLLLSFLNRLKIFSLLPRLRALLFEYAVKKHILNKDELQKFYAKKRGFLKKSGKEISLIEAIIKFNYADPVKINNIMLENYGIRDFLEFNKNNVINNGSAKFIKLPSPKIPIWLQLSSATLVLILSTTTIFSIVILSRQKESLYNQTLDTGILSLNFFERNSRIPLIDKNILRLNTLIQDASSTDGLAYAFILNNEYTILAHSNLNKIGTTFESYPNIEDLSNKGEITYYNYVTDNNQHILNISKPVKFQNKQLGYANVGISLNFVTDLIYKERNTIILITLLIALFGIISSVLLALNFSKPIMKMAYATRQISQGNYTHRLLSKRTDELGVLARAFNQMGDELNKQSIIKESFGKYVGPDVLDMILKDPENQWLKGHKNEVTILFTDIRGFSSYSSNKEPEHVVEKLNEYFQIVTEVITEHGGYVDKFIGDAVLGVFGVPVNYSDHVSKALKAANALQKKLAYQSKDDNVLLSSVGIGIDTGIVVAGNIGSALKTEYTAIGSSVNIASHLNQLAGAGDIIISKNVYNGAGNRITVEKLAKQIIKGESRPVDVYKLLKINE